MTGSSSPIRVERWPTEIPLLVLVAMASIAIWVLLAVSVIGLVYAALMGLFFFFGHLGFIAYVRGSAVKLGPEQFPALHGRVCELSARLGLRRAPDAYIMQAGGSLNALATKFFRSNFIILFSDLLDACGENTQARDMIVAHELGHLKAGHLRGMWLLLPGYFVPFLGMAWSRAREYTADRYGIAVCEDRQRGIRGICILAAGAKQGPQVNLRALVAQTGDLNTGWMTLGRWLSTHPPLSDRIAQIHPEVAQARSSGHRGMARAMAGMMAVMFGVMLGVVYTFQTFAPKFRQALDAAERGPSREPLSAEEAVQADIEARSDLLEIGRFLDDYGKTNPLPSTAVELHNLWRRMRPDTEFPTDPFDGQWYGYNTDGSAYVLWSAGRLAADEQDDITYDSPPGAFRDGLAGGTR